MRERMNYTISPHAAQPGLAPYPGPTDANLACLPEALKALPQWVLWRGEWRLYPPKDGQKPTKIPVDPQSLENADTTDPLTWGSYEACVAAFPAALEAWQEDYGE